MFGQPVELPTTPVPEGLKLAVGDEVRIVAGRNHGARAVILELTGLPTPTGSVVALARVERPRGGQSWEFVSCLVRT